jgi:hypothetical protein
MMTDQTEESQAGAASIHLTRRALTAAFFAMLVMAFACLCSATIYVYKFQLSLGAIPSSISNVSEPGVLTRSLAEQEVIALSIAYEKRIELLSTAVSVGLSFGFLGFALIVIGVRGDISAEGAHGPFSVKFAHLSPGVLVIVAATILIGVCSTRSLPLDMKSEADLHPDLHPTTAPVATPPPVIAAPSTDSSKPVSAARATILSTSDAWAQISVGAKESFDLLDREAKAITPDDEHKAWTKRTASFRSVEEALERWVVNDKEGQSILHNGGLPDLKFEFRLGLYAEYADDYNEAVYYFARCMNDPSLRDPKATWNDESIASIVTNHYSRAVGGLSGAMASYRPPGGASRASVQDPFAEHDVVQETFTGSIAQSVQSQLSKQKTTYEAILAILDKNLEWSRRDSNASAIENTYDYTKAELRNDPAKP